MLAQASRTAAQSDELRRQLGRFVGKDGQVHINSQGEVPGQRLRRRASPASPRCSTRTSRSAPPRSPARATTTRTPTRQGPLQDGSKQVAEGLCSPSSATSSGAGIAGRVLTLVWSEFGRRAQQNDSNGTDHGAAGTAFLMGTKVRQHMIGEFPGPRRDSTRTATCGRPRDFRAVYSSLLEQWFDVDAARIIPDAKKMPRYKLIG